MHLIDARGLACPQPVILTRKEMHEHPAAMITTLVSNEDQADNVRRMAESLGWHPEVTPQDDHFLVSLRPAALPAESSPAPAVQAAVPAASSQVVLLSADVMGRGPEELGRILMRGFLSTLKELTKKPETIILVNTGVLLAVEGADTLSDLEALRAAGIEILVCGTCANYFKVKEKIRGGVISNMYTIAEHLLAAGNVTSL